MSCFQAKHALLELLHGGAAQKMKPTLPLHTSVINGAGQFLRLVEVYPAQALAAVGAEGHVLPRYRPLTARTQRIKIPVIIKIDLSDDHRNAIPYRICGEVKIEIPAKHVFPSKNRLQSRKWLCFFRGYLNI